MFRTLCAEICSAIILVMPRNSLKTKRLLENLRAGFAGNDHALHPRFKSSKTTYSPRHGRSVRSSLFLNIGE
jgi:hypothetical protein